MPTIFIEYAPVAHRDVKTLIARLSGLFTTCFVIDEITRTVTEVSVDELDEKRILNLIFTANDRHREAIQRLVAAEYVG